MSKYLNNLIKKDVGNNLLGDNNFIHINNNIDINTKAKSNLDEDMTDKNLY